MHRFPLLVTAFCSFCIASGSPGSLLRSASSSASTSSLYDPSALYAATHVHVRALGDQSKTSEHPEVPLQAGDGSPPSAVALCLQVADERTLLADQQIQKLCAGAPSVAPVDCYEAADARTLLEDDLSVELCGCAQSTEPVDCYETTDQKVNLEKREIIRMCRSC